MLEASSRQGWRRVRCRWNKLSRHGQSSYNLVHRETFKEISHAYQILSDKEQRQQYDRFGVDPSKAPAGGNPFGGGSSSFAGASPFGDSPFGGNPFGAGGNPFGSGSFSSQQSYDFSDMFGGGAGTNIDLSDLLRQMMGGAPTSGPPPTPQTYTRPVQCTLTDLMKGTTKKLRVTFDRHRSKTYTIHIKQGWKEGTKITFRGNPTMVFVVQQVPHPTLLREGDDLVYRQRIPHDASVIDIHVTLPDGEEWHKKLSTKSSLVRRGQRLTVPDKGMPTKGGRGNLLIEFL